MAPRGRKQANAQHEKDEDGDIVLYSRRCYQCAQGHRTCSRTKPCKNCIGAGRGDLCDFPEGKSQRPKRDKGKERKQGSDENTEASEDLDVEMSEESAGSFPAEPMPRVKPTLRPSGMSVAMAFARVQVSHQQEEIAKTPGQGFIVPRLRPMKTGRDAIDQQAVNTTVNVNIGQPLVNQQVQEQDKGFPGSFRNQKSINKDAAGDFNVEFPLFNNGGRYTLQGASLNHPCMEYRNTGTLCNNPVTYPCGEDHSMMPFNPHPVCHDCRLEPDMCDVDAEEEMIAEHRIYFCAQCTEDRATGPALQTWEHPRRYAELKTRRVNKCSCHDELQKSWICEEHRILKARYIQIWGPEHVKYFRVFFDGDFCACCRVKLPQADGPNVMWQCAHCKDIVVLQEE